MYYAIIKILKILQTKSFFIFNYLLIKLNDSYCARETNVIVHMYYDFNKVNNFSILYFIIYLYVKKYVHLLYFMIYVLFCLDDAKVQSAKLNICDV